MKISKDKISEYYNIYPDGVIFSKRRKKDLSPKKDRYGYKIVCLFIDGKRYYLTVHYLVALFFIGDRPKDYQVNHKDGNKLNNSVNNLEYVTARENTRHAYDNGLAKAWNAGKVGVYSASLLSQMKLNQPNKKKVRLYGNGINKEFQSVRSMCDVMGFDRRTAQRVLDRKKHYNTIQGYKLEFIGVNY